MFNLIAEAMAAWNQAGVLLGGGFFAGIGLLLLGNRLHWRLSAARVCGRVIGVRESRPGMYYPVYRYVLPTGKTVEATSDMGSNSNSRMQTGLEVRLMVFESDPQKVTDANSYVVDIIAAVLTIFSIGMVYFALTAWPVTRITWIVLAGMVIYGAYHMRAKMPAKGGLATISAWKAKNAQQLEALPVRPLEEILPAAAVIRKPNVSPAFAPILVIVGIVLLVVGLQLGRSLVSLQAIGQRVPGTVVRLQLDSGSDNHSTYHAIIRFTPANGGLVEFEDRVGSNPPSYHTDEAVTVLYRPSSPQSTAIIDRGFWNWLPPAAVFLFGAVLIGVGLRLSRTREWVKPGLPAQ